MAKYHLKKQQTGKTKDKRIERIHYQILIGLMVFYVLHYFFIEAKTIGHDERYNIYILALPNLTGILALGIYRRKFLMDKYLAYDGFFYRLFVVVFYLIQGILFSYLSFGAFTHYAWNYLNTQTADKNPIEIIYCPVDRFFTGKNNSINFKFQDRAETIGVSRRFIEPYIDLDPDQFKLELTLKKGIWNYYVLKHWKIIKR